MARAGANPAPPGKDRGRVDSAEGGGGGEAEEAPPGLQDRRVPGPALLLTSSLGKSWSVRAVLCTMGRQVVLAPFSPRVNPFLKLCGRGLGRAGG